jgi:uncharacterized protein DUF349
LHALSLADDAEKALAAVQSLSDETHLILVARSSPREEVARAAMGKLHSGRALAAVARQGKHEALRMEAVALLSEPEDLRQVAQKTEEKAVALAALERIALLVEEKGLHEISVAELLGSLAERARNKVVARRARALMRGGDEPSPAGAKPQTDRLRQRELCEAMEALGAAPETAGLPERIDRLRGEWIDLVPQVDPDFEERFESAWRAAKEHVVRLGQEEVERRSRETEAAKIHTERVEPRWELIRRVESLQGKEGERALPEARREWEFLRVLDTEEGETLRQRFEQACAACEARLGAWKAEKEAALEHERKEAGRKEKERREKENLRRCEQICARAERLLVSETTSLKAAARSHKEVRAALESPGPFPSAKDRKALLAKLGDLQASWGRRLIELRRSESWKHWANEEVQEELCRRAEALSAQDVDPMEAGHRLTDLQARWRQASAVSREKSQELWQRFKSARDAVRVRMESHRREQAERKNSLCRQAEELAGSSDWIPTTETLKRLQAEWKNVGSCGRAQDRALWERFRAACDQFFTRRKQDLKQRKQDWAAHLKTRVSLCEQAEAHAGSSEWDSAAAALKKLQAEWKGIGAVSRKDSEATWKRFRAACDGFFERYKRRHEIEREARVARLETICADLEALSLAPPPSEGLPEKLRSLQARWSEAGETPAGAGRALEDRYQAALDRVLVAFPEALKDSEYDALQNRRMMEELLARVEKLAAGKNPADSSALSPATRLAAMWVEAMAANTIGGSVGSQAEARAAQDEVRKAQIAWRRIGYVPREMQGDLADRFWRACGAILPEGQEGTETPSSGSPRGRPR